MDNRKDFNIQEELKKLPAKPGVYLMHDDHDEIIYVGKAIKLKNRVRQYFQSERNKTTKIRKMVSHIAWFEYIVTDSETEALVLECNLIKEYRPHYNTMLMDDKGYPFIRVTDEEAYPRVLLSRTMKKDKSLYFGPYTSSFAVKETLELLNDLFKLRTCNRQLNQGNSKERACLNYHMGKCLAPCQGYVSREDYRKNIDQVIRFLSGDFSEITNDLKSKMEKASEELNFEEAIRYRELLNSVNHVAQKQKITDSQSLEDRDFIACYMEEREAIVQVFYVRDGKLMGREHFRMEYEEGTSRAEILENFVIQYYSGTPFIPREIYLQEEVPELATFIDWLSEAKGRKVSVIVPKRGQKERFLELAENNAKLVYTESRDRLKREEARTTGAVSELSDLLGVFDISRMEAYDISNISGFESVGSMVVFVDGKPKKNDYRKFRIRTVAGPDDYASMEEVLTRRFEHGLREKEEGSLSVKFNAFPDLILMDGGKGQVHAAENVLASLGLNIPVAGMVKDDHHNTRGLYYLDEELPIDTHSEGFHLITRIQDEAHRFAITYHRGLHTKGTIQSVLREIPGVGATREKALMRHFADLDAIRKASVEDIAGIDGFNRKAAEEIVKYLHGEEGTE